MQLHGHEVNPYTYRDFRAEQLKNFRSVLKSNIKNFENIVGPATEEMTNEDKAEELLPLIEREIKVRKEN